MWILFWNLHWAYGTTISVWRQAFVATLTVKDKKITLPFLSQKVQVCELRIVSLNYTFNVGFELSIFAFLTLQQLQCLRDTLVWTWGVDRGLHWARPSADYRHMLQTTWLLSGSHGARRIQVWPHQQRSLLQVSLSSLQLQSTIY